MTAPARVALLAYPEVDELDLFGAFAVLAKASSVPDASTRLEIAIAADTTRVVGSAGTSFTVTADLSLVEKSDAVVVPGGRGAPAAAADARLLAVLRAAGARRAAFYGVCSGTLLIAAAGLARDRRVAVHGAKRDLLSGYPVGEVTSGLVRDGRISTIGGERRTSVKSVDLAFQLLADLVPDAVEAVAARMELRPEPVGS